jgi:hypothetical protein
MKNALFWPCLIDAVALILHQIDSAHCREAGICGRVEGDVVSLKIRPDIPDPRCAAVAPHQQLWVANGRQVEIQARLAGLEAAFAPGDAHLLTVPLGSLLAPCSHRVEVLPGCGAELWPKESRDARARRHDNPLGFRLAHVEAGDEAGRIHAEGGVL